MSIQKVVEELTAKKKREMEGDNSSPSVGEIEPTAKQVFLDESLFPKIANTVSYSELVGEALPNGDDPVYPKPPKKWDKEVRDMIPDVDPEYIVDHEVMPHVFAAITHGHNLLTVGPTGAGKTTDVREACARLRMPYVRVNGVEGMEFADLAGQIQLSGGETRWVEGPIMPIVRHGGVLAIDEPFKMSPGSLMGLQWLAEPAKAGRSVMLYGHPDPDKVKVPAHPEFRMALCDNARGTGDNMDIYAATNVQDASFINRMQYKLRKNYMPFDTEVQAVMNKYKYIKQPLAERMCRLAILMRTAWNQGSVEMPFSFRELETWSEIIAENGGDIRSALLAAYGNMLEDGDEREILAKGLTDVGL